MNANNEIKNLNAQVDILEKQKDILFGALSLMVSICTPQNVKNLESAVNALYSVQADSASAMEKSNVLGIEAAKLFQ